MRREAAAIKKLPFTASLTPRMQLNLRRASWQIDVSLTRRLQNRDILVCCRVSHSLENLVAASFASIGSDLDYRLPVCFSVASPIPGPTSSRVAMNLPRCPICGCEAVELKTQEALWTSHSVLNSDLSVIVCHCIESHRFLVSGKDSVTTITERACPSATPELPAGQRATSQAK